MRLRSEPFCARVSPLRTVSIENYGKYQLIKRLAMGGMAQIYLARQRGPEGVEKQVVVKRILPHLAENEDFVRMFLDEARIAARLNHPNIVQIFDLGAQDDSFFIAMEYIHGEDLRRVWKKADRAGTPIPVPLVCRIITEACAGLDYAHKRTDGNGKPLGIVHRDISPQNILLTFEGRVKVVDFGIAKAADQATVTRSGVLKGKYSYMSPEQAAGQKVDCRSDIFALGVVLYELLTCNRLFKRPSDMATLQAVGECDIPPPSQVNPRVPKDLDALVMKALTRRPEDRYAEAVQLQRALEEWLVGHPVPSSSAHVAEFMKNLYAARLAEEARLGDVLVEESDSLAPEGKSLERPVDKKSAETVAAPRPQDSGTSERQERTPRTPSRPSRSEPRGSLERRALEAPRPLDSRRASELVPEPRSAERPVARASRVRHQAVSTPVPAPVPVPAPAPAPVAEPRKKSLLPMGLLVVGVLVGLGLGAWWALRPEPVQVPAAVPPKETAKVEPRPKPPEPSVPRTSMGTTPREEPKPPVVSAVRVTLRTKPEQVSLTVDGKAYDKAPVVLSARPGQELTVRAEAARYRPLSRKLSVGQAPEQDLTLTLEPEPVHREEHKTEPVRPVVSETRETPRKAMVRFVVKPITVWAEVSCNGARMGETPFRDVQMTVGTYECKFSNPDQGTRTRRVEVKPGIPNIVVVQF